ncbi:FG-GAP-like repeat-containing protein, partial [Bacteroidota bacterium]
VKQGSVKWGDYDSDGDLDIFISGTDTSDYPFSRIYRNDDNDIFVERSDIEIENVTNSSGAWGDNDNDGDLDFLLAGLTKGGLIRGCTRIYKNNNDNTFSEFDIPNSEKLRNSSVAWGDYDNDGDLDILLTGEKDDGNAYSRIFMNNTLTNNSPPDIPGNLTSKVMSENVRLCWNKSTDTKTLQDALTYNVVVSKSYGNLEVVSPMSDINTGYRRIVESGNAYDTSYLLSNLDIDKYYWSVQSIDQGFSGSDFAAIDSFTILPVFEDININLMGVDDGSVAWGDYDNDNDLDILITGKDTLDQIYSKIYKNNGNNYFIKQNAIYIKNVTYSSAAWGDYDNDGYIDILITGVSNDGEITKVFKNYSSDYFIEQTEISLIGVYNGLAAWGDYNNDGYLDILITGESHYGRITKVYKNNGDNTFTEQVGFSLEGVENSSAAWGDYNNDGYLDILMAGYSNSGYVTKIYKNNGDYTFTEQTEISLIGLVYGSVDWGDYNNDGYQDIVITGADINENAIAKIYTNNGDNSFSEHTGISLRGVENGNAVWGDYDNDGDLDILLSGQSRSIITLIYRNEGNGIFTELDFSFLGLTNNSIAWGDYDNDGDLDILMAGLDTNDQRVTKIYQNHGAIINSGPSKPVNLQSIRDGYDIQLKWDSPEDDITPTEALTYNIRIGTYSGGYDVFSPMSDSLTGVMRIPYMGNCNMNTQIMLDTLLPGTYYWSVQAVDQAFTGGEWADEKTFNMTILLAIIQADTVCFGDSTHFIDQTFTAGESLVAWKWYFGDGDSSSMQNPVHLYTQSGSYNVTLIASSNDASDTTTQTIIVKHKPVADFSADIVCHLSPTTFTNSSFTDSVNVDTWLWDFDDGITSNLQDPGPYTFLNVKNYNVKLEIVADNNCYNTITKSVVVGAIPVASASSSRPLIFCDGDSTILNVAYDSSFFYQWQLDNTDITGADSNIIIVKNPGIYRVIVTNTVGNCQTISNELTVTVLEAPSSPSIIAGSATTFCEGDSLILSVTDNPNYNYHWKINNGDIGDDTSVFVASPFSSPTSYIYSLEVEHATSHCIVTSSNTVAVNSLPIPSIPTVEQIGLTSFCEGDSIILKVSNNLAYTYQWKNGLSTISGATDTNYTAISSGDYNLEIENINGCIVNTDEIEVTVKPSPIQPTISTSGTSIFCQGDSIILSVIDNSDYTFNWKLEGGATGQDTNVLVVKPNTDGSYTYNLIIENSSGCLATSANTIAVTVLQVANSPEIIITPNDNEICLGESVQLSVTNNANYNYLWKRDGADVGEDTNRLITQPSVSGTYQYSLEVEHAASGCITTASNMIDLTVRDNPVIPTISLSGASSFCDGNSVELSVSNNLAYTYQWKRGINIIEDATSSSYIATTIGNYNLQITNGYGCVVNTDLYTVTVYPTPVKPSIERDGDKTFCEGKSVVLSVINDTNNTYQWKNGDVVLSGANTNAYTATSAGKYLIEISNSSGCNVLTDTMPITVLPAPNVPSINYTGETTFCEGDSLVLSTTNTSGITYQWKDGNSIVNEESSSSYVVYETGEYSLTILNENSCYNYSNDTLEIVVNSNPVMQEINSSGGFTDFCNNESITLSVNFQTGKSYQWKRNGRNIPEATDTTCSNILTGTNSYSVIISNLDDECFIETQPIDLNVYEKPSVPVIDLASNTLEICPGEIVSLDLTQTSSDYQYLWKFNGDNIDNESLSTLKDKLKEGAYSVVAKVGICESESQDVTISYKDALPVPELVAFGPVWWYLACSNDTANNYRWYYNGILLPGETRRDYVAGQDLGEYYVEVNDGGECYVPSEVITIPPDLTTGIEKESVFGTIKIYPNPTPGLFTIEIENNLYGELMIDINNEAGVRILMMEILKNHRHFKTVVDLSGQGKGLYFIGFKFEKDYTVRKLVVE